MGPERGWCPPGGYGEPSDTPRTPSCPSRDLPGEGNEGGLNRVSVKGTWGPSSTPWGPQPPPKDPQPPPRTLSWPSRGLSGEGSEGGLDVSVVSVLQGEGGDPPAPPRTPSRAPRTPRAPVPPQQGHLAGKGDEGGLDLRVVGVLEEVVGLEDVMGLHPVARDGPQEVPDVLQLRTGQLGAWPPGPAPRPPPPAGPQVPLWCTPPKPRPPHPTLQDPPHLVPVLDRFVHLLHGAGLQLVDEPGGEPGSGSGRGSSGGKGRGQA